MFARRYQSPSPVPLHYSDHRSRAVDRYKYRQRHRPRLQEKEEEEDEYNA